MTQVTYIGRLAANNLMNSPASEIVTCAGHELWNHMANHHTLVQQLCQNFHHYGRSHGWQWIQGVGANAGANLGRPTNMGATTPDRFITSAGTVAIDATWQGNVRTLTTNFAALGAYRFTAHSWNRLVAGMHYDASTNNTGFANKHALYYCTLGTTARNRPNCFLVTMRHQAPAIPGPGPYYCIGADILKQEAHQFPIVQVGAPVAGVPNLTQGFINALPATTGSGNWTPFLLVSAGHLPAAFVANYL
ncbi:hypothetical protein [Thiolapillus sp.]|uniref:hypothetical protein n=1 Tax=Thiolapillus sp. TaxID=2017437 RepID=UPI003AF5A9A5